LFVVVLIEIGFVQIPCGLGVKWG